jgi:type II secretory pathway component PulK
MRIRPPNSSPGIALIIVLIVIVALGILAGGFAYTMKVETKLARNASFDVEMEWLARSGFELAKYVLGQGSMGPQGQVDSLNQKWAGGPGSTNDPLGELPLENYQIGNATLSVKIEDNDRKFNINMADEFILRNALTLIGVDASESTTIIDSILDWRDPDDDPHSSGTESDTYESFAPPYFAKNGPIDDLTELLLVRGVTPALYWGSGAAGHTAVLNRPVAQSNFEEPVYVIGLKDLFTPLSSKAVNVNTTTATVLQILSPAIDETIAHAIIQGRTGPDGTDGTDDDMPYRSPQDIGRVGGLPPEILQQVSRYFTVRSLIFNVTVTVQLAGHKRTYTAVLRRNSPRDIQVLNMNWQ